MYMCLHVAYLWPKWGIDITLLSSGGHVLGYGGGATPPTNNPQSTAAAPREKLLHKEEESELMEIEESGQDKKGLIYILMTQILT